MTEIRSALDPRLPTVVHALTVAENGSTLPADVTTLVGDIVARVRSPFTTTQAARTLSRVQMFRIFSRAFLGGIPLLVLGLFLLGPSALTIDPLHMLFTERSAGALLFWIGASFLLLRLLTQSMAEFKRLPMPVRNLEDGLPVLPDEARKRLTQGATLMIDDFLTADALRLLATALADAEEAGHAALRPVHVLRRALSTPEGSAFLRRAGIERGKIEALLERLLRQEPHGTHTRCDTLSYAMFHLAFLEAWHERLTGIGVLELLLGALRLDDRLRALLLDVGVPLEDAMHVASWVRFEPQLRSRLQSLHGLSRLKPAGPINLAFTSRPTPLTDSLTTDLTLQAAAGKIGPLLGRDDTLGEIFRILHSHTGSVLLVGEPGAGKTELLRGIAQLMASEEVPGILQDKRCLCLDPGSLIAGADGTGTIEARVKGMIKEITAAGNVQLVIEDIHHLLGAGSTKSSEDAGSMLMNALSQGDLSVIATTTTQEFSQYIQPRAAFLRRFQIVRVPEMDRDGTLRVLQSAAPGFEQRQRVTLTFPALVATWEMCKRYMPDRHFPDKALRILEEACTLARQRRGNGATVGREDVATVISEKTRSIVTAVTESEADQLLLLEEQLRKRVVGQDDAIAAIGSSLRRARTGLRRADRPISTLFFLGPTGVGKTETAKAIAALAFGGEDRLIRLDLSEFRMSDGVEKLLGSNGRTSPFLDAARRCPAHLLLLDEFEKASPDVLNIFLQLFEDGRLTDGKGQTVSFTESLIIATSNIGSLRIQQAAAAGKPLAEIRDEIVREELLAALRPELVNRFDRVILFRPLGMEQMAPIVELQLQGLSQALEKQGLFFHALPEAINDLALRGYDPTFGARGLRRVIQDSVEDEVAKLLLQGRAKRRDTIILGSHGAIAVRRAEAVA